MEVNSTGTKGLGEPALIPAAAAIANAFYNATGVRATVCAHHAGECDQPTQPRQKAGVSHAGEIHL